MWLCDVTLHANILIWFDLSGLHLPSDCTQISHTLVFFWERSPSVWILSVCGTASIMGSYLFSFWDKGWKNGQCGGMVWWKNWCLIESNWYQVSPRSNIAQFTVTPLHHHDQQALLGSVGGFYVFRSVRPSVRL